MSLKKKKCTLILIKNSENSKRKSSKSRKRRKLKSRRKRRKLKRSSQRRKRRKSQRNDENKLQSIKLLIFESKVRVCNFAGVLLHREHFVTNFVLRIMLESKVEVRIHN